MLVLIIESRAHLLMLWRLCLTITRLPVSISIRHVVAVNMRELTLSPLLLRHQLVSSHRMTIAMLHHCLRLLMLEGRHAILVSSLSLVLDPLVEARVVSVDKAEALGDLV